MLKVMIALGVATGLAVPAVAQQKSADWTRCENRNGGSLDLQIGGCTAVIQLGKETTANLAVAFNSREGASRPRDSGFRRGDQAEPGLRRGVQQSRRRIPPQGPARPRDPGL